MACSTCSAEQGPRDLYRSPPMGGLPPPQTPVGPPPTNMICPSPHWGVFSTILLDQSISISCIFLVCFKLILHMCTFFFARSPREIFIFAIAFFFNGRASANAILCTRAGGICMGGATIGAASGGYSYHPILKSGGVTGGNNVKGGEGLA